MSDESTVVLKEIAALLKQRVEQEDAVASRAVENSKRSAEVAARMQGRMESMKMPTEGGGRLIGSVPGNREEFQAKMEKFREEDRQFRKSLILELERHNTLLSEIIERLRQSPKE
jgi:hypothetical protein